eukprot:3421190-Prymnesium_polylepis.1
MGRSAPQPSPAAAAHDARQPAQTAHYRARSGTVRPAGSTGRSAGVHAALCSVRAAASGGMSASDCFRCGVPGG